MPEIFSVKEINHKGEKLSEKDSQRLLSLGFKKVKGGYIIDLADLGKKKRRQTAKPINYYSKVPLKEVIELRKSTEVV